MSRPLLTAFTLIELLVAVTIMTLITFTLYSMFNQTQKAMRANNAQVDVLESGRAAAELMSRELEGLTASYGGKMDAGIAFKQTNLYVGHIPLPDGPLRQYDVDDKTWIRTNVLQEFFFLSSRANYWTGIGYRVIGADKGVGSLYRFETRPAREARYMPTYPFLSNYLTTPLSNVFTRTLNTNFNRVADGIIHLRLRAYDSSGYPLAYNTTNQAYLITRLNSNGSTRPNGSNAGLDDANVIAQQDYYLGLALPEETRLTFISNAIPAYLELELGVLEPEALKRYQALKENPGDAAVVFLRKQSAKVHLFRQRIPIRTSNQ